MRQDQAHPIPTADFSSALPPTGFLRLNQVLKIIPVCRATWYAGIKAGRFPAPVAIGPRARGYRVEDLRSLLEALNAQSVQRQ
jgi:predicted DNA-binding transcriptional regulator AlpA